MRRVLQNGTAAARLAEPNDVDDILCAWPHLTRATNTLVLTEGPACTTPRFLQVQLHLEQAWQGPVELTGLATPAPPPVCTWQLDEAEGPGRLRAAMPASPRGGMAPCE